MAKLFDPLGFLAPFIIRGKILLQQMWIKGLEWDEKLDENLKRKSDQWFSEFAELKAVEVQRCLQMSSTKKVSESVYHTFVDASENAYGVVIYSVNTYQGGDASSMIVASKSRVAPLKVVSIPRLELMAAQLGVKLTLAVIHALEVPVERVTFWSDSTNVLGWIKNKSRTFKPFVANRIGDIQAATSPSQWRHLPSEKNPANKSMSGMPKLFVT